MRVGLRKTVIAYGFAAAAFVCGVTCGAFAVYGFYPFACAAYTAFVLLKRHEYEAVCGAALGIILRGAFLSLIPLAVCFALNTVWRVWQRDKLGTADRIIMLCISGLSAMCYMHGSIAECALTALMSGVSVLFALGLYSGTKSLTVCVRRRRLSSESELVHVGILLGLCVVLLCPYEVLSVSAARLAAGMICLVCACIPNIYAMYAACIASLGAGLVYAVPTYSAQIAGAYIISCTAAALTGGGKRLKTALVFSFFLALTGTLASEQVSIVECIVPATIMLAVPKRHISMLGAYLERGRKDNGSRRLRALARVTESMSAAYETVPFPSDGELAIRQISAISDLFADDEKRPAESRYSFETGTASLPKEGCAHTGDSMGRVCIGTKTVVAVSDGMGSGLAAHTESGAAIQTFLDMQKAGFNASDSIDGANRRLLSRGNEMYATLDVLSADGSTGMVTVLKAGAPPSYLLRGDRVKEFCGESLPVGIVEKVTPAVTMFECHAGDTIFIMTDGVHDALGSGLYAAMKEKTDKEMTAKETARILLETAAIDGSQDDMSIVCIKVSRSRSTAVKEGK